MALAETAILQIATDGETLYWHERRPTKGKGRRGVVVRWRNGTVDDVTPAGLDVGSRVHDFGGGSFWVHDGALFFVSSTDQRVYRRSVGGEVRPVTPEPDLPRANRHADGCVTPDGRWTICVREVHTADRNPRNEIALFPTDGSAPPRTLVSGADFYAYPRVDLEGRRLAWIEWSHPRMPWDGTRLQVATFTGDGQIEAPVAVAGSEDESIFQPRWSPSGHLCFVSDRTGWWNLYALVGGETVALLPVEAEFGSPLWTLGRSRYAFLGDGTLICSYTRYGRDHLALLRSGASNLQPLETPFSTHPFGGSLEVDSQDRVYLLGASPTRGVALAALDPASGRLEVVREPKSAKIDSAYLSTPEPISFPTRDGSTAHAFYYPPTNEDFQAPQGDKPPLLVMSHGGPTRATSSELRLALQFWTSRGFAVVDVNYRGSTGYGRAYREALRGRWGEVDVTDCIDAAQFLVGRGDVDSRRMAIRGKSAGGFTALAALVFHEVFAAGASYYGVADLLALAASTHKFESRYLDGLVGPYPEAKTLYRDRSPIHSAARLNRPLILFQGLDDPVVTSDQAQRLAEALSAKGLPHVCLLFEGEGHGFSRPETIERCLRTELSFYASVFGLGSDGPPAPEPVESW